MGGQKIWSRVVRLHIVCSIPISSHFILHLNLREVVTRHPIVVA
jgi:hypothetical protein